MKEGQFQTKVVAVTGGVRGIGKNIAHAFAKEGAVVILCDKDEEQGLITRDELRDQGTNSEFLRVDLREKGAPQSMIQQVVRQWGKLDILVNNAKSGERRDLLEEDEESWEEGISVMLRAAFFASQEAIRAMSKTGGGRIVNVSSVAAFLSCKESPVYHVAKAGLVQMTRYLADHGGRYGVRVNAVAPGFIVRNEDQQRYEGRDNQNYRDLANFCHPVGQVGNSEDVAKAVIFLCSEEASFITGQCLVVDGGLTIQEQSGLLYRLDREQNGISDTRRL